MRRFCRGCQGAQHCKTVRFSWLDRVGGSLPSNNTAAPAAFLSEREALGLYPLIGRRRIHVVRAGATESPAFSGLSNRHDREARWMCISSCDQESTLRSNRTQHRPPFPTAPQYRASHASRDRRGTRRVTRSRAPPAAPLPPRQHRRARQQPPPEMSTNQRGLLSDQVSLAGAAIASAGITTVERTALCVSLRQRSPRRRPHTHVPRVGSPMPPQQIRAAGGGNNSTCGSAVLVVRAKPPIVGWSIGP